MRARGLRAMSSYHPIDKNQAPHDGQMAAMRAPCLSASRSVTDKLM